METIKQKFLSIDEMITKTNIMLKQHDILKKEVKNNLEILTSELNKQKSEIDIFILFEVTNIKISLYQQINKKIKTFISLIKQAANN